MGLDSDSFDIGAFDALSFDIEAAYADSCDSWGGAWGESFGTTWYGACEARIRDFLLTMRRRGRR